MTRTKEFEPSGPWSTHQVESLFTSNAEKLRQAGFVSAYLRWMASSRQKELINAGIEGHPMVLRENIRSNGMCDALLLGTVDIQTGLVAPYTETMIAYGNDNLEWELVTGYKELDVTVVTEVLASTQELGLMATDSFGSQAWL